MRLVLLISCCHALVHVYEHALGSVEKNMVEDAALGVRGSDDDSPEQARQRQERVSGELGNCLRLPFGFCALLAGWMTKRYGAKRMLLLFLTGCSLTVLSTGLTPGLMGLYVNMFVLGLFASIYHPAGVSLISMETTPENRTRALGYHGIFGSLGIALGPLLAGIVLSTGADWRQYYLVLAVPGLLLAVFVAIRLPRHDDLTAADGSQPAADDGEDDTYWRSYVTLLLLTCVAGVVYAAILHFLPRYLDEAIHDGFAGYFNAEKTHVAGIPIESAPKYLASALLLLGVIGQYTAGRIARPTSLEWLTACSFFGAAPFVLWMGSAEGVWRVVAVALFTPLFFMHQPLYNSLVAKYVPRRQRSLCYGLSFALGFGIGSFGTNFAGRVTNDLYCYATLAALLCIAASLALVLWRWHGPEVDDA